MSSKIFIRSAYNYDRRKASLAGALVCRDKSLAQQHQKDEADINTIVKRFGITGQLPQSVYAPTYDDFDVITDYREALDAVRMANESFMKMPAEVRSRFENNAQAFVEFCSDSRNKEEMKKMGLTTVKPDAIVASKSADSPPA